MLLSEYLRDLTAVIADLTETGLILSSELTSNFRTNKIGLVKGTVLFTDDSKLFFKEYLDLRYVIEKEMYAFHYQDENGRLLFRYDNASHKPSLDFINHKHIGEKIIQSDAPDLGAVLEEIINNYLTA